MEIIKAISSEFHQVVLTMTVLTYARAEADAQLPIALPGYAAAPLPGYGAPLIYTPNPTSKKTPVDFKKMIKTYSALKDARGNLCAPGNCRVGFMQLCSTRSLRALRAPTSSLRPLGLFDFVLRALQALRPCDPCNVAVIRLVCVRVRWG